MRRSARALGLTAFAKNESALSGAKIRASQEWRAGNCHVGRPICPHRKRGLFHGKLALNEGLLIANHPAWTITPKGLRFPILVADCLSTIWVFVRNNLHTGCFSAQWPIGHKSLLALRR